MKLYYAHPMSSYNKKEEENDIKLLKKMGFNVLNPNKKIYSQAVVLARSKNQNVMEVFYKVIKEECNALAYRSFPDGKLGAGVAGEIYCAKTLGYPIYKLPTLELITDIDKTLVLSIQETREYIKKYS